MATRMFGIIYVNENDLNALAECFLASQIAMLEDSHYWPHWKGYTEAEEGVLNFARKHANPVILAQYNECIKRYERWED